MMSQIHFPRPSDLVYLNLYSSGAETNGLSCETVKRQPKISFHRHFKDYI